MGKIKKPRELLQLNTAREVKVSSSGSGAQKVKSLCIQTNIFSSGNEKEQRIWSLFRFCHKQRKLSCRSVGRNCKTLGFQMWSTKLDWEWTDLKSTNNQGTHRHCFLFEVFQPVLLYVSNYWLTGEHLQPWNNSI